MEPKTFVAALCRLSTNSTAMFEFPTAWGDFDFDDVNEQVRACEMIMAETGAMWIPVAYARTHSQEQIEEFREKVLEKMNLPACDLKGF